jgi:2-methylcitrate dehydratase PrpD
MTQTLSARFAAWINELDGSKISSDVVNKLKLAVLDTLASTIAGARETVIARMLPYAADNAGKSEATIIGHRTRTRIDMAALVNGTMAHACDYDDSSWTMWGHPSAPVLPAALAIAESNNLPGLDFLTAFAVGLEIEKAIGLGSQPDHYQRGYHSTGSIGVFGAAAASAKLLGLADDQIQMAFGIAASRAAGLRGNFGTMTKPMHVGFAARDGLEAALLAQAGITGHPAALDGHMGFFQVLAPNAERGEDVSKRLGNPFEVINPGLSPKLYSSCSESHAAVDAILEMRAEGLRPTDVKRIRCGMTPAAQSNLVYPRPITPLEAKFSQEYCLAAALVRGKLGLSEFTTESVKDPAIQNILQVTSASVHPELSGADSITFSSPAIVEVETKDGKLLRKLVREMKGHPKNPLSENDLRHKFMECAATVLPEKQIRAALDKIMNLDRLDSIRPLVADMTPTTHS